MIDGLWDRDGARLQGWLARLQGTREVVEPGGMGTPELGLVLKVKHKDDPENVNGNVATYDIVLFDRYVTIPNVPAIGFKNSRDSGDEYTLKACTNAPDLTDPTQADHNFLSSDGDLVVVLFLSGIFPVIAGTLSHTESGVDTASWHGATADGERRAIHHKGSSIVLEDDSTVELNLPDTKDLVINIDGVQVFKVVSSGGVNTIELGTGATERVILGDTFRTWFNTNINTHTHTLPAVTVGETPGTGIPSLVGHTHSIVGPSGALSASMPEAHLSDVTKTE